MTGSDYAELQVATNFSFLRGASHPHELVETAAVLGHSAIGIADRNSLSGVVRMHLAAKEFGLRLVVGCRLDLRDGTSFLCYPTDRAAYGRLAQLLTVGKTRAPKGECWLDYSDLSTYGEGQILVALPPADLDERFRRYLAGLRRDFGDRLYLALTPGYRGQDARRLARLAALAQEWGVKPVATNDVLYHCTARRRLQDVMTCIREGCTVDAAGLRLEPNAERHLKPPHEMARLFRRHPEALAHGRDIVERCRFSLDELRYEYPDEIAPDGERPQTRLARLAWAGSVWRYGPEGAPEPVRQQIAHELELIERLDYAPFFLTVEDIVRFAREQGILHQGRGSAANSAVCYMLGITEVDPARSNLLFERFISDARREPPDIDVDFEHERREEVIQYVYRRFGRNRAGLAATVIRYRSKGAIREVGKALGLSPETVAALSGLRQSWSQEALTAENVREAGLDPEDRRLGMALELARELMGFPRHLSQHPGGFVITRGRLDQLVPIENAAMLERTLIGWDKDDIDALGILKVDVLALGMLTCIAKSFGLIARHYGRHLTNATVPAEDPLTYEMLCRADSVGVFQVESRAQQTMLPRLKPRSFYDLVIEVAIVRPGPIQGDMVHPYLRRRQGLEQAVYPKPELEAVLAKTLGVPLFQEQCMRIAIVAAEFTPSEADQLRRAMATFRHVGTIHSFREKFVTRMVARGYEPEFAARCFSQIEGFGTYGFPESHAASFALLVYVSAWIKCHYPAVFCCALLNSQPMGFYAPAQLVRDAREHGVEIRAVDVEASEWDHTLEPAERGFALRLGFRLVAGLAEAAARNIVRWRGAGYGSVAELVRRTGLDRGSLARLVEADALASLSEDEARQDRRQAAWLLGGLAEETLPLFAAAAAPRLAPPPAALPALSQGQAVAADYTSLGLTLGRHPMSFLRKRLAARRMATAAELKIRRDGSRLTLAGIVLFRQQPGTAKGTIFITIEDETGSANLIVWPHVAASHRRAVFGARLLTCTGRLQREGAVIHVVAETLRDDGQWLSDLHDAPDEAADPTPGAKAMRLRSRDFR